MTIRYQMVHYRQCELPEKGDRTLETGARIALNRRSKGQPLWLRVLDRIIELPGEGEQRLVLNRVVDLTDAIFGELCLVQGAGLQGFLELKASNKQLSDKTVAECYDLAERKAPDGSQFARGMAYWLAIADHLFFVKTQSTTAEMIETYLGWLLHTPLSLHSALDRTTAAGDIGDITSFRVAGSNAVYTIQEGDTPPREVATSRRVSAKDYFFDKAKDFADLMIGKKEADELIQSLGPRESLVVDASLRVTGRRTAESRAKLRALATELADSTDAMVTIKGKDGQVSGTDAVLRTRMPFELAHPNANFLEFDNVADQLRVVYQRFVDDGKIEA